MTDFTVDESKTFTRKSDFSTRVEKYNIQGQLLSYSSQSEVGILETLLHPETGNPLHEMSNSGRYIKHTTYYPEKKFAIKEQEDIVDRTWYYPGGKKTIQRYDIDGNKTEEILTDIYGVKSFSVFKENKLDIDTNMKIAKEVKSLRFQDEMKRIFLLNWRKVDTITNDQVAKIKNDFNLQ